MKNLLALSALAAVLAVSATYASAETIQLGSYATGQSAMGNSNTALNYAGFSLASTPLAGTSSSFLLNPTTVWVAPIAGSTYVGAFADAGPGGNNPASGYYTFTTTFTSLLSSPYTGSISVLADDTAQIFLNGVMIVPFGALGGNAHCADTTPNCSTVATFAIGSTSLLSGANANRLTFVVQQAGDQTARQDPSGLDFSATLTASAVPEPSTLLMLGTGLMGSAGAMYRRLRS